ncbi:TetR/AcrR family transcriptional regulator [Flavobacterium gelatinilyticum]|uniref:TetR/AcrR family transcriptional regulator n=1 Tax=Flavobacterium gelatinilyticum TaxID=3003260 RepID=UPI00247FAC81|nr:TetR/AcrR family transcriptional regulator [Flavobacterium gelatinilyticum]
MKETKQHILETSYKLFLSKTFKEVSMKELVDAAGLSKGAFYHYFSSKEELFREVIEQHLMGKILFYYDKLDNSSLQSFYTNYLELLNQYSAQRAESNDSNLLTMIFEAIRMFPELRENFSKLNTLELNIWTEVVVRAKQNDEIKTKMSNESIAQIFIFTRIAVGIRRNMGIELHPEKIITEKLRTVWNDFYNELKSDLIS